MEKRKRKIGPKGRLGRTPYSPAERQERAESCSFLISQITKNSGETPEELERIFKIGSNGRFRKKRKTAELPENAGNYWRKLKNGARVLPPDTARRCITLAIKKGWLDQEEWGLPCLLAPLIEDRDRRLAAKAEKIEKHLAKIVKILTKTGPLDDDDADNLMYIQGLGRRLREMYLQDFYQDGLDCGETPEQAAMSLQRLQKKEAVRLRKMYLQDFYQDALDRGETPEQAAKSLQRLEKREAALRQFCVTDFEKMRLSVIHQDESIH